MLIYWFFAVHLSYQNNKTMKKEFQIFKHGVTKERVTILSKEGEVFDRKAKIRKYKDLGYQVFDMNNKLL